MVVLNRIYTRTGDEGTTGARHRRAASEIGSAHRGLWHGRRGQCGFGIARLHTGEARARHARSHAGAIQNDLFDLGADLCTPESGEARGSGRCASSPPRSTGSNGEIDALNAELAAAALLRTARRPSGGGPSASGAHGVPAGRAGDGGAGGRSRRGRVGGGAALCSTGCPTSCSSRRATSMPGIPATCCGCRANRAIRAEPAMFIPLHDDTALQIIRFQLCQRCADRRQCGRAALQPPCPRRPGEAPVRSSRLGIIPAVLYRPGGAAGRP